MNRPEARKTRPDLIKTPSSRAFSYSADDQARLRSYPKDYSLLDATNVVPTMDLDIVDLLTIPLTREKRRSKRRQRYQRYDMAYLLPTIPKTRDVLPSACRSDTRVIETTKFSQAFVRDRACSFYRVRLRPPIAGRLSRQIARSSFRQLVRFPRRRF